MPGENANARACAPRPYGVLGRTLGHSYTPVIYRELAGLDYVRFEREPACVEAFLRGDEWEGVNVTIPYKKAAAKIVDELSPIARRLGNVNTVTRLADGRLRGDNTDYYGFKMLVEALGLDLAGKRALVFGGHGGAGSTCMVVLGDLKMEPVAVCRTPESAEDAGAASAYHSATYDELDAYRDAALVVNATPVGMYPDCPASVWPLDAFPALEAVVDIVYNPARTGLMMEAERRGIPAIGGLLMLVAQAAAAVERYTGEVVSLERIRAVTAALDAAEENIALIGMPGAGNAALDCRRRARAPTWPPARRYRRRARARSGHELRRLHHSARRGRVPHRGDRRPRARRRAQRPRDFVRRRRGRPPRELRASAPERAYRHARSPAGRAFEQGAPRQPAGRHRRARRAAPSPLSGLGRCRRRVARDARGDRPKRPGRPVGHLAAYRFESGMRP